MLNVDVYLQTIDAVRIGIVVCLSGAVVAAVALVREALK